MGGVRSGILGLEALALRWYDDLGERTYPLRQRFGLVWATVDEVGLLRANLFHEFDEFRLVPMS